METFPFTAGVEYLRQELLGFVGSKQAQSGVIWGPLQPGCVICTSGGRHGKKAGYFDEPSSDGSWLYFGQGGSGDQSLGNAANSKLLAGDRSVLLFTAREPTAKEITKRGGYGKLFTFQGAFNVAGVESVIPDTGPRKGNRLLRFFLIRAMEQTFIDTPRSLESGEVPLGLHDLRQQLSAEIHGVAFSRLSMIEYRRRSQAVHRYAQLRANGSCELCLKPAPFHSEAGHPYLEVHHIHRLADDGPDAPQNVAAICPNCHRAVHHAHNRIELNATLAATIVSKEAD